MTHRRPGPTWREADEHTLPAAQACGTFAPRYCTGNVPAPRSIPAYSADEIASLPIGAVVPITAASGAGKTTMTLAALVSHARDLGPAILVSRELSHAEVAARIVGRRRGIPWADVMRAGDTDDARTALSSLPRLVVLADDDATIGKAEATVAALRAEFPDQPVVVAFDYLQILDGDGTARDERTRIAGIAEAIRRFAKRAPALVLAVSQSSRAGANALRKGDVVGADTATTGAESSQIERGYAGSL